MNDDVARVHAGIAAMGVGRLLAALGLNGRGRGDRWRIACPVHRGAEPNCVVEPKDGTIVFVCHSACGGEGGDAIDLVAAVRGIDARSDFGAALREAASVAGIAIDTSRSRSPYDRQPRRVAPAPIDPAVERHQREIAEGRARVLAALAELCPLEGEGERYLADQRGLDPAVCRAHGVGYVGDVERVRRVLLRGFPAEVLDELGIVYRGEHLAFERHPLLFFIVERGAPVYVQGRALAHVEKKHERWRSMRGGVPCLWGVDSLAGDQRRGVVLAEGPIDGITAVQWAAGRRATVAVFGAGGLKPEWCKALRGRSVTIALDPDDAGDKGAARATAMLHAVGAEVRRLAIPDGLDLNAWFCAEHAA